jgi:16S rRNA processing protein RimM
VPPRRPPAKPPRPRSSKGYVAVGYIRGPHGLRGELTVDPLTDFARRFAPGAPVWVAGARHTVRGSRAHKGALLVELDEIASRSQAEQLRGRLLEIPERELTPLEEGTYYRFQVIGMTVVDGEGHALGRVDEVLETGANDVYIVRDDEGELLIPAIDSVIREVDVPGQRMVVELLEGLERRPSTKRRQSAGSSGPARPS